MSKTNWYKKAEAWYKFSQKITLYHGTNEKNLQAILKEGFDPIKPEALVEQILSKYNLSKAEVPDYIWKEELSYRKEKPYIHFTTSKEQAIEYAKNSIKAGEFENSILNLLIDWLEKEKQIKADVPSYKPVVITVDVPWDRVKTHKSLSELKEVVNNVIKNKDELLMENENIEDFLSNLGFEFMISDTLPKDYIIRYDFV